MKQTGYCVYDKHEIGYSVTFNQVMVKTDKRTKY